MTKVFSRLVLMLLSCLPLFVAAQSPFSHYFQDTLKPGHRVSGSLDSTDRYISAYQSTLPDPIYQTGTLFQPEFFLGNSSTPFSKRYSSIAHVGLFYAMGSASNQPAGISYTQQVSQRMAAQFDYRRSFSNDIMRNSAFEQNTVFGSLRYVTPRYAGSLDVYFQSRKQAYNGGLLGDSLTLTDESLVFQSVSRSDADHLRKHAHLTWRNYVSFSKDSTVKTGVYVNPELRITNRRFTDGQIFGLYNNYFYDSLRTNDYRELREIHLQAGYFFHSSRLRTEVGINNRYWDYDNLNLHRDTTELQLQGILDFILSERFSFKNQLRYTLTGAQGELLYKGMIRTTLKQFTLAGTVGFERAYPQIYQRYFSGNHVNYDWNQKQLQTNLHAHVQVNYRSAKTPVKLEVQWNQLQNNAWYLDSAWRQDTITSFSMLQGKVGLDLSWRKLILQPAFQFGLATEEFLPAYQAMMRIGFRGALFKAQKLQTAIGLDLGYIGSFRLLDFDPMMHAYYFSGGNAEFTTMPKIHVFANFDLGFFRWFLRVENIEQTFVEVNQQVMGYPVAPLQLRFGFSWDLFN